MVNLHPLTPHIIPSYTHKMVIVDLKIDRVERIDSTRLKLID